MRLASGRRLLNGASGTFRRAELAAILGPRRTARLSSPHLPRSHPISPGDSASWAPAAAARPPSLTRCSASCRPARAAAAACSPTARRGRGVWAARLDSCRSWTSCDVPSPCDAPYPARGLPWLFHPLMTQVRLAQRRGEHLALRRDAPAARRGRAAPRAAGDGCGGGADFHAADPRQRGVGGRGVRGGKEANKCRAGAGGRAGVPRGGRGARSAPISPNLATALLPRHYLVTTAPRCLVQPTTGLDASASFKIARCLKHAAEVLGVTVLTIVHQPRAEVIPYASNCRQSPSPPRSFNPLLTSPRSSSSSTSSLSSPPPPTSPTPARPYRRSSRWRLASPPAPLPLLASPLASSSLLLDLPLISP